MPGQEQVSNSLFAFLVGPGEGAEVRAFLQAEASEDWHLCSGGGFWGWGEQIKSQEFSLVPSTC